MLFGTQIIPVGDHLQPWSEHCAVRDDAESLHARQALLPQCVVTHRVFAGIKIQPVVRQVQRIVHRRER